MASLGLLDKARLLRTTMTTAAPSERAVGATGLSAHRWRSTPLAVVIAAWGACGPEGLGLGLLYTECTGTGMFYGFGYILIAGPLLSCPARPVSFGDYSVLRGHIVGASHRLRRSPQA